MMSADPFVPDAMNGQAWNRYSYVVNNPLALTDPNGYCFLGMCTWGKAISTFFNRTFGVLFRDMPILGTLFEIAAVALCMGNPVCMVVQAFEATTFVAGVTSGNLGYALRAGLIAGVTAAAFYEVGNLTDAMIPGAQIGSHTPPAFGTDVYAFNVAGHALVGCGQSVASGGKCGPGALAGAMGSAVGPVAKGYGFAAGLVTSSVAGGLGSVAGGGKLANGALTAAFGYLFNKAVNQFQIGNDAHTTLENYAQSLGPASVITERWFDGLGAFFGGRVDTANTATNDIWDIKSSSPDEIARGVWAVQYYSAWATNTGNNEYSAGGSNFIFGSASTLTLPGYYGDYTYWYARDGVIAYNPPNLDPQYIFVPIGRRSPSNSPCSCTVPAN
jgi:hypothetical protein